MIVGLIRGSAIHQDDRAIDPRRPSREPRAARRGPAPLCRARRRRAWPGAPRRRVRPRFGPAAAGRRSRAPARDARHPPAEPRPRRSRRPPPRPLIDEAKAKLAKLRILLGRDRGDGWTCSTSMSHHQGPLPQGARVPASISGSRSRGCPRPPAPRSRSATARRSGTTRPILEQQMYYKFSIKPVMERLNSPDLDPKLKEQFQRGDGVRRPRDPARRAAPLLPLRAGEGRRQARRQGRLDPPRDLEEPPGPDRPRSAPGHRAPASCRPTSRWTPSSTWARTTAGPTSSSCVGQQPTKLIDTRKEGRRRPQDRLAQLHRAIDPTEHHAGLHQRQAQPDTEPRRVRLPGPQHRLASRTAPR